jgi:hypothetical protein
VTVEEADQLWVLLLRARDHGKALLVSDDVTPQAAVDRTVSVATGLSSLQAMPVSVGGFVTKVLLNKAAEGLLSAVRTVFSVAAVRAVCEYAAVRDPREQHRIVAAALTGRQVPVGWEPPAVVEDEDGVVVLVDETEPGGDVEAAPPGASPAPWQRGLQGVRSVRRVAKLRPDEAKLRHTVLSYVPVVGIVGAAASEQDTMIVVIGRAASLLGLPGPSPGGIRKVTVDVARLARDQSVGRLMAGVHRDAGAPPLSF